jgi:hypothetical protein
MKRAVEIIAATIGMTLFAFLMVFVLLNFMLGCETWDEARWTETNSCVTVFHAVRSFTD